MQGAPWGKEGQRAALVPCASTLDSMRAALTGPSPAPPLARSRSSSSLSCFLKPRSGSGLVLSQLLGRSNLRALAVGSPTPSSSPQFDQWLRPALLAHARRHGPRPLQPPLQRAPWAPCSEEQLAAAPQQGCEQPLAPAAHPPAASGGPAAAHDGSARQPP